MSSNGRHHGAIVIATDPMLSWFLLQQKCQRHPDPECRGKISFIGGKVEAGETPQQAMIREAGEEFPGLAGVALSQEPRSLWDLAVTHPGGEYDLTVFERLLYEPYLRWITMQPCTEGRSIIVPRAEFLDRPFIYGLQGVAAFYLNERGLPTREELTGSVRVTKRYLLEV